MRTFGPAVFREDTELTDSFSSMGPLTAKGNLKGIKIKTNGPLQAYENLEIVEQLKVNGPLVIKGTLSSSDQAKIKVNGPVNVDNGIIGGKIKINGPLTSSEVDSVSLRINGSISVREDVIAREEIYIAFGFTSKKNVVDVGGVIEAPLVHLKNHDKFSNMIPGFKTIKRVLGLQSKYEGTITLEDLRIRTNKLILEGVEIINSEIQADEIQEIEPEYNDCNC